jgi:hypothetical protein
MPLRPNPNTGICSAEDTMNIVEHVAKRLFGEGVVIESEIERCWADLPDNDPELDIEGYYRGGWPETARHLIYLTKRGRDHYREKARTSIRATLHFARDHVSERMRHRGSAAYWGAQGFDKFTPAFRAMIDRLCQEMEEGE